MTYSILLTFDEVGVHHPALQRYEGLQEVITNTARTNKTFRILSKHTIMIPLSIPLEQVGPILSLLGEGIRYKYAIVPQDFEWIDTEKNI
jgi:hypothetical protein